MDLFSDKQHQSGPSEKMAHILEERRLEERYEDIMLLVLIYLRKEGYLLVSEVLLRQKHQRMLELLTQEGISFEKLVNGSDLFAMAIRANLSNGYVNIYWKCMLYLTPKGWGKRDVDANFTLEESSIITALIPLIFIEPKRNKILRFKKFPAQED